MRIIDNKHDFYDYLQDPTDTLVFDRRGSFTLTKEMICDYLTNYKTQFSNLYYRFILLQCGFDYWLFLVSITNITNAGKITDYDIELLHHWQNYDKSNNLLKLDLLNDTIYKACHYVKGKGQVMEYEGIKKYYMDLCDDIDRNDIRYTLSLNNNVKITGQNTGVHQYIPILETSGISPFIDAQQIFCAIEEHFSTEKTKLETTEAKGATNDDKIIMHGFDTKTSFRGK